MKQHGESIDVSDSESRMVHLLCMLVSFLGDHPGCLKTRDPKSMVDVGISYIYICWNTSHLYYKPRSFCEHLFIILLAGAQVLIANDMKWKDRTIEAAA